MSGVLLSVNTILFLFLCIAAKSFGRALCQSVIFYKYGLQILAFSRCKARWKNVTLHHRELNQGPSAHRADVLTAALWCSGANMPFFQLAKFKRHAREKKQLNFTTKIAQFPPQFLNLMQTQIYIRVISR